MALRQDNPFNKGFRYAGDDSLLYRDPVEHLPTNRDSTHLVVGGDRLDVLAGKYYNNSKYWWIIYDVNPGIDNPFQLQPGTVLIIPNIDTIKARI